MDTFLWVEKYRPKTVKDCILPKKLKDTFQEFVKDKHIPNLILSGSAGTGKTTIAKAMVEHNLLFVVSWKSFTRTVVLFSHVIIKID